MRVSVLLPLLRVWAHMAHFPVKSGGFCSELTISICAKYRSSMNLPKCEGNCVRNKLITDTSFKTFAYLKFS